MTTTTTDKKSEIKQIMKRHPAFDSVEEDGDILMFSGRGNGNGTDCEIDPALIPKAKAARAQLQEAGFKVELDYCDEWVYVNVTIPE